MDEIQQKLIEARRNAILEAAIEVIANKGFQRTTIKEIAKQAGVADGTIYNYFKNKDAILFAIVEMITQAEVRDLHFSEAVQQLPQQFIEGYVKQRMAEVNDSFQALKVILPETITNRELSAMINEKIYEPVFEISEAFFQQMMDNNQIKAMDAKIATRLFAAPIMGLVFLRLLGDAHVTQHWDTYAETLGSMLTKLFIDSSRQTEPGENDEES